MADVEWDKLVALPSTKSKVWTHYGFPANSSGKIVDKKKVYCKLCDPPLPIPYSTNTSNLMYHLQQQHLEEHKKVADIPKKMAKRNRPQKDYNRLRFSHRLCRTQQLNPILEIVSEPNS